jgi:hypothetical protein
VKDAFSGRMGAGSPSSLHIQSHRRC